VPERFGLLKLLKAAAKRQLDHFLAVIQRPIVEHGSEIARCENLAGIDFAMNQFG
jgi:hypothetical protein